MAQTFFAEMVTSSKLHRAASRLEISLADTAGQVRTISFGPDAVAALVSIAAEAASLCRQSQRLTKIPTRYDVGHGRHEPYVMLRFEDETAYGLSAALAAELAEALLEEAESVADSKYCVRQ